MNHLSLFSGIGGLDLAAHWAGMTTVAFCERDEFCKKVLAKHWPSVPIWSDIHEFTRQSLSDHGIERIDIISGGFPCQPFSDAGRKRGKEDDRYLWPQMLRIIEECQPAWVVGENVTGIINMALDDVLVSLEGKGYTARPIVFPASAVGAWHQRQRVFIVAHADSSRQPQQERLEQEQRRWIDNSVEDVAHAGRSDGIGWRERERSGKANHGDTATDRRPASEETQRLRSALPNADSASWQGRSPTTNRNGEGFASWTTTATGSEWIGEPAVGERIDGIPARLDEIGGINAESKKRNPSQVLSVLQQEIGEESFQGDIGRFGDIQEAEVLRPKMHGSGLCQRCAIEQGRLAMACPEDALKLLRIVWGYDQPSRSSHRREYFEQLNQQYPDLMRELSRYTPPPCTTCWQNGSWEDGLPRTIKGTKGLDIGKRLKALGNAVVPQQAYPIFKTIMDIESSEQLFTSDYD